MDVVGPLPAGVFADAEWLAARFDALRSLSAADRLACLEVLLGALAAQTLRDVEPDAALFQTLLKLLPAAWDSFPYDALSKLHSLVEGLLRLPEFAGGTPLAAPFVTPPFLEATFARLARPSDETDASSSAEPRPAASAGKQRPADCKVAAATAEKGTAQGATVTTGVAGKADLPAGARMASGPPGSAQLAELGALRQLLYWLYSGATALRPQLRVGLGEALLAMGGASLPPPGLRCGLELCAAIVGGFDVPKRAHRALALEVLLPLHRPAGRIVKRRAIPTLACRRMPAAIGRVPPRTPRRPLDGGRLRQPLA